jgi:hypothetical protein
MRISVLAAALVVAASAGCGRAHLNPSQGAANSSAFAAQQVNPSRQRGEPATALDAQEADVISQSYLRSLAGKSKVEKAEPVLYVAPPQRGLAATPLAPSVPKN